MEQGRQAIGGRRQGFRFVRSAQFVRRLSESVELGKSLLDGFGDPSYESIQYEELRSPVAEGAASDHTLRWKQLTRRS